MGTGPGGATRPVPTGEPACRPDWTWRRRIQVRWASGQRPVLFRPRRGFCGPGGAIGCMFASPGVSLSLGRPWAGAGENGDSSDSPQGPLHVLAVHRARPDLSEVRAGQPARPSGPLGLSDPSSLWPALPGGRSAAWEAWTCVKLRETQAKSPRPGRNLLAENPAVGLPRAASAGRVPLCPPVGLCGHRHR